MWSNRISKNTQKSHFINTKMENLSVVVIPVPKYYSPSYENDQFCYYNDTPLPACTTNSVYPPHAVPNPNPETNPVDTPQMIYSCN